MPIIARRPATIAPAAVPVQDETVPEIRQISTADLRWALKEGWEDFRDKRGDLLFIGLLYPVVCLIAAVVTFNNPLIPLFFPLVAGLSIAGPAVASGFYELARRRGEGRESTWVHFFDPIRGRSCGSLITLTIGLAILFVGWLAAAWAIYAATFGTEAPLNVWSFLGALFTTPEGWALIVLGHLAGAVFALASLVFAVVSFPMVVDKCVSAETAVLTSIAAFRRNPGVLLGWGVRVGALLVLGTLPFAIGLAVVLPWLGYATWHLYTRLVVR